MKYLILSLLLFIPIQAVEQDSCEQIRVILNRLDFKKDKSMTAGEFEEVYNQYHLHANFKSCLIQFISTDCDKNYWIGIFLYEADFTRIENLKLAKKILRLGIKQCREGCDWITFHAVYGSLLLKQHKYKLAKKYFKEAWSSNIINGGGCFPAMSEEEYDFIKQNLE